MKILHYPIFGFLFLSIFWSAAQEKFTFPPLSPKGSISQVVGNTTISMVYELPAARGRTVFGELVPWGEVWRTGAGNCTKISFDKPVKVGGKNISSGIYALFTIPDKEQWTIIFNRDTTLYGAGFYDSKKDVVRFTVMPNTTERFYETLDFDIEIIPNNAAVYISWANTQVSFPITTTTDELVEAFIKEELLTGRNQEYENYVFAADYYYFQNKNLDQAIWLADKAIETGKDGGWARHVKIDVYERLQEYEQAIAELELEIAAERQRDYEKELDRQQSMQFLQDRLSELQQKAKE
ncbi:DUF2911 domain-containing protein [Croceitalea dokdonensis]|uniref:DUF2911 domain-containing protein n=1 Tax=Croceitalea dokdonensis TaxID=346188 RepID=UPI0006CA37EC|nr:DUF2911 domain-containing protein [Croceitalea dokdonensis]